MRLKCMLPMAPLLTLQTQEQVLRFSKCHIGVSICHFLLEGHVICLRFGMRDQAAGASRPAERIQLHYLA